MSFWDKIKAIFIKQKREEDKKEVFFDELVYTGLETKCWACENPIHETHRQRKLAGNRVHKKCFNSLKKIALNGGSLKGFNQ